MADPSGGAISPKNKARSPDRPKLSVLDLFSGIGGFSLGLERTGGFKTSAFCEIDGFARSILRRHWPVVPIFDDVVKLSGRDVGPIDVICGGFANNRSAFIRNLSFLLVPQFQMRSTMDHLEVWFRCNI